MEGMFFKNYFGGVIARFINKGVEKKLNYNPEIIIDGIEVKAEGEWVTVKIDATIRKENFDKLMEEVTK